MVSAHGELSRPEEDMWKMSWRFQNHIGGGWARICEQKEGARVELRDHMKHLWSEIGFKPENVVNEENEKSNIESQATAFTPPPAQHQARETIKQRFTGISIWNLPKDVSRQDLHKYLTTKGLPDDQVQIKSLSYKKSSSALIEEISQEVCLQMIANLHEKFYDSFGRRIYCSGISGLDSPLHSTLRSSQSSPTRNLDKSTLGHPHIPPGLSKEDQKKLESQAKTKV